MHYAWPSFAVELQKMLSTGRGLECKLFSRMRNMQWNLQMQKINAVLLAVGAFKIHVYFSKQRWFYSFMEVGRNFFLTFVSVDKIGHCTDGVNLVSVGVEDKTDSVWTPMVNLLERVHLLGWGLILGIRETIVKYFFHPQSMKQRQNHRKELVMKTLLMKMIRKSMLMRWTNRARILWRVW